jgi:hypothetical protein
VDRPALVEQHQFSADHVSAGGRIILQHRQRSCIGASFSRALD